MPQPIFESTVSSNYFNHNLLYPPTELHLLSRRVDPKPSFLLFRTLPEQIINFITNFFQRPILELFVELFLPRLVDDRLHDLRIIGSWTVILR